MFPPGFEPATSMARRITQVVTARLNKHSPTATLKRISHCITAQTETSHKTESLPCTNQINGLNHKYFILKKQTWVHSKFKQTKYLFFKNLTIKKNNWSVWTDQSFTFQRLQKLKTGPFERTKHIYFIKNQKLVRSNGPNSYFSKNWSVWTDQPCILRKIEK